ncbi:MAG: FAD-dependent monooxygenase [Saprospiraceae bacterium]|nr:FAD-dependent monooxygenase [Saprospiraceae bacterium]
MPQLVELVLLPGERHDEAALQLKAARQADLRPDQVSHIEILKSSLDARSRQPVYRVRAEVYGPQDIFRPEPAILAGFKPVATQKKVIIVGAGPAGYFAALELLEQGIRPIVLDRGKDAQTRRRDLRAIQQFGKVNPHSNYCFGEGGAGTYSDGKLYTRSIKRGDVRKALRLLVEHGAKSDILTEAHPHIGSNKLPGVVQNIRATIQQFGGEVHFGQHVTDFILKNGRILGVATEKVQSTDEPTTNPFPPIEHSSGPTTTEWLADAVILATGHSARDIYRLLHRKNIRIEAKPFALGVRVEHPQPLIDDIQYKRQRSHELPAASYSLVCQIGHRGVFSFCMCPGGLIVPAATAPGEIVMNGMSMSRRDSPFANSGIVTAVELEDLANWQRHGAFAAMQLQGEVEQRLFQAGDGSQKGPALRLPDFIAGKLSATLPPSSYIPGLYPAPLFELLPTFIYKRLRDGLAQFGRMMRGFHTSEANVVATESRSSAPVRIPRDPTTLMHPDVIGLFPTGEGAGYAGGIISAAMDGQRIARAVMVTLEN